MKQLNQVPNAQSGFSFFEVLIALTVFGLLGSSTIALHTTLMRTVYRSYDKWYAFREMNNWMVTERRAHVLEKEVSKKSRQLSPLDIQLFYQLNRPKQDSVLAHVSQLGVISVGATWQMRGKKNDMSAQRFVLLPVPLSKEGDAA